jgi:hypothetical protein
MERIPLSEELDCFGAPQQPFQENVERLPVIYSNAVALTVVRK